MTCEETGRLFSALLYGELEFEEEEALQSHLDGCARCREQLGRERSLHRLLDDREMMPSPLLLREQRLQLLESLEREKQGSSWIAWLKSAFWVPSIGKPAGAVALVALGFLGAQTAPLRNLSGLNTAGLFDPNSARVRYVEPGQSGEVQIVVDETRQRVLSGRLDDAKIRALLLSAAKDPSDPGLRGESVDLLKAKSGDDEIRGALVYALEHDLNAGVRLKALDGLRPFAAHPEVRKAFARVLLSDQNPGIRTQAIDLLVKNNQEPQLVGVLQELMQRENNGYIRSRCEKALHAMKASVETY
jgi:hypothetical protein